MPKVLIGIIIFLLKISSLMHGMEIPEMKTAAVAEQRARAEYARSVAGLVHENSSLDGEENILIVKTDGKDIDFERLQLSPVQCIKGWDHRYTLSFQSGREAQEALKVLEKQENVIYAELDQNVSAQQFLDGDKEYKKLRSEGARKMGFELLRKFAGVRQGDNACTIAVIDSGTFPHPDYSGRLILTGYDYVDMDHDATNDLFGHGTKVTGILADCTDSLNVSFLPIRVLNASGNGKISNLINSIYEAVDQNADILNLSLTTAIHSEALEEAVRYAIGHNCTVVFAAGNYGKDIAGYCPSHLDVPGLIVVGSAEESENGYVRSGYSNYGAAVDVYAIGTRIECCSNKGGYTLATGTSFAAPHISAACAIFKLLDAQSTPPKEEEWIKSFCHQEYEVPVFSDMIPQSLGVELNAVKLSVGDVFCLKKKAEPESSGADVVWTSSDEKVAKIQDGNQLVCVKEGSCTITGTAAGFCQEVFGLEVSEENGVLRIPEGVVEIQEESFAGLEAAWEIVVPDSVKVIGEGAFKDCVSLKTILYPDCIVTPDGEVAGEKKAKE